jgi:2-dehydro-3-deoxyphosphooctonate aldolase (KDO 8-P synthase)
VTVRVRDIAIGEGRPFVLIAGPCVIESEKGTLDIAETLSGITSRLGLSWIFKASYDKANRSAGSSFRGVGMEKGLEILERVRADFGVPILSDVHDAAQVQTAAERLDVLQIPAFLCRQTDLLIAAGKTGKPVNIKKGQFMAPEDMAGAAAKVVETGNPNVLLTERGASFGYHNLVADMRSLEIMREIAPVVFDATHSVQLPSAGKESGGERRFVPVLARAATAAGIDGLFLEVHPNPAKAMSDAACQWPLDRLEDLLAGLMEIDALVKSERFKLVKE